MEVYFGARVWNIPDLMSKEDIVHQIRQAVTSLGCRSVTMTTADDGIRGSSRQPKHFCNKGKYLAFSKLPKWPR
ncbi:hypothetical protein AVEN_58946-1 [Araneus ventricosus]|uniref:Uncharacterized protein n=1 Tax=Araneus ventricosus TaxID=182803 RepID=A0A4Y2ERM1_ARAVE|nr:hypothetical protein AVEN_58946-1 [Araneus ventricosus]